MSSLLCDNLLQQIYFILLRLHFRFNSLFPLAQGVNTFEVVIGKDGELLDLLAVDVFVACDVLEDALFRLNNLGVCLAD